MAKSMGVNIPYMQHPPKLKTDLSTAVSLQWWRHDLRCLESWKSAVLLFRGASDGLEPNVMLRPLSAWRLSYNPMFAEHLFDYVFDFRFDSEQSSASTHRINDMSRGHRHYEPYRAVKLFMVVHRRIDSRARFCAMQLESS